MSLPPHNEKTQSIPVPDDTRPAGVAYRQVLRLSLGLGGTLQLLCLPALASSRTNDVQQPAAKNEITQAQIDREIYSVTASAVEIRPLLSLGSFGQGPKLSRLRHESVSKQYVLTASSILEKTTAQPLDAEPSADDKSTQQLWSIAALSATADSDASTAGLTQALSVLDIQNIELVWGEAPTQEVGAWIRPIEELIEDTSADTTAPDLENSYIETDYIEDDLLIADASDESVAQNRTAVDASFEKEAELLEENELYIELLSPEAESAAEPTIESSDINAEDAEAEDAEAEDAEAEDVDSEGDGEAKTRRLELLSESLSDEGVVVQALPVLDEELGTLRMVQLRSRENEELGILRLMQTATANTPTIKVPAAPVVVLGGRLGFVNVENVFRATERVQEQVYQSGLSLYLLPSLSDDTSLFAIADTNIARYNTFSDINDPASRGIQLDYNEIQLQAGVRHRLLPQTYAQLGWRNQRLYSPGYREKLFGVHYIDALVSHRSIISPKAWLDSFYQMRLGFADPQESSRFRQTLTLSLNYGVTRDLRASLLYQLDFDDYTQINRYDTYQQLLGIVSYNITPESRISVFGGTRFGRSSSPNINLDDTFYGAGLNVSVPLF